MIHDQSLLDYLSALRAEPFNGNVFRATRLDADPTAPSVSGGRWSPAPDETSNLFTLYTSLDRDGAIAEVASLLASLTPVPGPRHIKVATLSVSTSETVRLTREELEVLGVDFMRYGERDYLPTQKIGSALAWLGWDGTG